MDFAILSNDKDYTIFQYKGILKEREKRIQQFIKDNYLDMYMKWKLYSKNDFYDM